VFEVRGRMGSVGEYGEAEMWEFPFGDPNKIVENASFGHKHATERGK